MPANGGDPTLSEEDLRQAVQYMLAQAGISVEADSPASEETSSTAAPAATSPESTQEEPGTTSKAPEDRNPSAESSDPTPAQ
jgi:hypothetical protein